MEEASFFWDIHQGCKTERMEWVFWYEAMFTEDENLWTDCSNLDR
jgi:hypothetical protein